jgi:hypothetical protein
VSRAEGHRASDDRRTDLGVACQGVDLCKVLICKLVRRVHILRFLHRAGCALLLTDRTNFLTSRCHAAELYAGDEAVHTCMWLASTRVENTGKPFFTFRLAS